MVAPVNALCSDQVILLFSHRLSYSVPFPCIFHGISIFTASLAHEHQAPARCSWVVLPGPDLAHMDMNRNTWEHTQVCKHGTGQGWHELCFHNLHSIACNSLRGSSRKDVENSLGGAGQGMASTLQPSPGWCHGEMGD